MVFIAAVNNISCYIVAVSFIGGGNLSTRRKLPTCRMSPLYRRNAYQCHHFCIDGTVLPVPILWKKLEGSSNLWTEEMVLPVQSPLYLSDCLIYRYITQRVYKYKNHDLKANVKEKDLMKKQNEGCGY